MRSTPLGVSTPRGLHTTASSVPPQSMRGRPRFSVVIPTWNGAALLPGCLSALAQQRCRTFETIVVDDGSTDGSVRLLERDYPWVQVVARPRNGGFVRAVNDGILASRGEIICLLNNDTEPDAGWLEALERAAQAYPHVAFFACKLLLWDRRTVLHSAGDFYGLDGVPGSRGVWQEDRGQYDACLEVFAACGAAAAFRRSLLDDIGLFDDDLVQYCEDVDLAWRAALRGHRGLFVPDAIVYHRLSATGGGPLASYYCGRNFIAVLAKDVPALLLRRHWRAIVGAQLRITIEALQHVRSPAARARLRGQLAGLVLLPRMLGKRRRVQAGRRVSVEELEALLRRTGEDGPQRRCSSF
jgi:GT2 family glycosyltransferase